MLIKEVQAKLKLSPCILRYYEKMDLIKPYRNYSN